MTKPSKTQLKYDMYYYGEAPDRVIWKRHKKDIRRQERHVEKQEVRHEGDQEAD